MKTLNLIYHMLRADFFERIRRSSFFVTLGLAILIGYIYIPPADASTLMLALGPWRVFCPDGCIVCRKSRRTPKATLCQLIL